MKKKALDRLRAYMRKHAALWIGPGVFFLLAWWFTGTGCVFHATIGLPCPGCGLTRALLAALRGDLAGAWQMHPLFWLAPLILISVVVLYLVAPAHLSTPGMNRFWLLLALLFLVVFLVRMLLYFPEREPLVWNDKALLPRIWSFWKSLLQTVQNRP